MFRDVQALRNAVEKNGGVLTVSMADLKQMIQAGRLGVHVRGDISAELADEGLAHSPSLLPHFQTELVRIYQEESPLAPIIYAVENPSPLGDELLAKSIKQRPGRKPVGIST